ncbi:exostosin-1-like [Lineus longissimus]|uniref:exostosin-1-like n=1 Tax=Lineus longissimus TaxID=88925 RepID=UPI002B4C757B
MQAKKRYLTVCVIGVTLLSCYYFYGVHFHSVQDGDLHKKEALLVRTERSAVPSRSYVDFEDFRSDRDMHISPRQRRDTGRVTEKRGRCRMETCFDFSICQKDFKVFVYPTQDRLSNSYSKILTNLRESRYYTTNPKEACIFVLSIDTLDRDTLSKDYIKGVQLKLNNLLLWNNGKNHIIFNLYSGTWPEYSENLGFDIGEAMLAKASISTRKFRTGFDISIPLFSKEHPLKGGEKGSLLANNVPPKRQYLLAFKGKRYLIGIGSETRNALYHIHNNEDIILLTTCKHGKNWKSVMDDRCKIDNVEYEKYDYQVLLTNSTFCLVPRGRRLGSFRFLEALQAACVPVILSNGWELPFSEVIDWNKAAIWGDERLLLQVPSIVRSISHTDILSLRQQNQFLWQTYFSSVERIVATVLEILKDRIVKHVARPPFVWNTLPGAASFMRGFSDDLTAYPFYYGVLGATPGATFTAVIYTTTSTIHTSTSLYRVVKNIAKSALVDKILIIWNNEVPPPSHFRWPVPAKVPLLVIINQEKTIRSRFYPYESIQTDAVLSMDDDAMLTTDEINFAFSVWRNFPDRIVGYPARNHIWDDERSSWGYTSKWTNDYSMVLTGAAFYHRYYNYLYTHYLPSPVHKTVDQTQNCEDILMNFLVSHVIKLPPIKVTQRKIYKEAMVPNSGKNSVWLEAEHFNTRQTCINVFVNYFGYMPLIRSSVRLDPLLFKDPVSMTRKKYKQIENVGS